MPQQTQEGPLPTISSMLPKGVAILQDPALNKGTAFTEAERDALKLRGLLPPNIASQELQLGRIVRTSAASRPISRNTSICDRYTTATRRCSSAC